MKRKSAFTLIEMLLTIALIGIFAAISYSTFKTRNYIEKSYTAKQQKILKTIDLAMAQIKELNPENCPLGSFIVKTPGGYKFAIVDNGGSRADAVFVLNTLFGEHIKYYESDLNFNSKTVFKSPSKGAMPIAKAAAMLPGDILLGLHIYDDGNIKEGNCPNFVIPETKEVKSVPGVCWGILYVDLDGFEGSGVLHDDVYEFGLGADGIMRSHYQK